MTLEFNAGLDDAGRRLDRIVRKCLPDYPLSLIHRLLRQGKVLVNGVRAGPATRMPPEAVIQIVIQKQERGISGGGRGTGSTAPPLPAILWRGAGIIVFNKPAGLAVHGDNSLDTAVQSFFAGKLPPSLSFKPGPLHRLDKPTSGIIAFSESLEGAQLFSRLLRDQKAEKTYLAIVEGCMQKEEVWQDILIRDSAVKKTLVNHEQKVVNKEQKPHRALTTVKALASNGVYSLIEAHIITGRTHQIRASAAAHGHPLAGDTKYGGTKTAGGFFLHAWKLAIGIEGFPQPLIAPLPASFSAQIDALFPNSMPQ